MLTDDDGELLTDAAREVAAMPSGPMQLVLKPVTVIQLAGLLQLATRHPGLTEPHLTVAREFLRGARAYFADCPAILDIIARGDDPTQDR